MATTTIEVLNITVATKARADGRSTPIDQRTLPAINGAGLTQDEFFRVNGYSNRARVAYAEGMPDADSNEIAEIERRARMDGLRAVLRDRPAAPPLPDAACCAPDEAAPCAACVDGHIDSIDVVTVPDANEETPEFRVTDDLGDVYYEKAPGLTLERVIDFTLARLAENPKAFEAERVVWDGRGNILAIVARREDGLPQAIILDSPPEYIDVTIRDTVDSETPDPLAGADAAMTAEELADLAKLNATNPAGAIEADLSKFPAYTSWPESTANWHYNPTDEPAPLLTLPELIEQEAARMRRMETGAGDLMRKALEELARVVRVVSAVRPDQVAERLSILENYTEGAMSRDWEMPEPEMTAGGRIA